MRNIRLKYKSFAVSVKVNELRRSEVYKSFGLVSLMEELPTCIIKANGLLITDLESGETYDREGIRIFLTRQKMISEFLFKDLQQVLN